MFTRRATKQVGSRGSIHLRKERSISSLHGICMGRGKWFASTLPQTQSNRREVYTDAITGIPPETIVINT